ncbi:MAG TPA: transposase [Pyrinomonadaceae bacterium]
MSTQIVSEREAKALEIAARTKLTRKGDVWIVPSQSGPKTYKVNPDPESPRCTCPDFEFRQQRCKHIYAVEIVLQREVTVSNDGLTRTVTETVTVKRKYTQDWQSYNKAQTTEKSHFLAFLYELCSKIEEPSQKRGRGRPRLPLADIIFTVTYKTYSTMSSRRFASDMRDALAKGYVSKLPSFNSVFDYLQDASLTPYLKYLIAESAMPLKSVEETFAVDSSGFSTSRFVRWFDVKYGNNEDWHDWIKMHLTCGVSTHIVTSVELSTAMAHDSPYFKPLIDATAKAGFNMKEIVADKGYISKDNLQTAVDHGATPYIPFKTNTTGKSGSELWKKLFHYYSFKREEFLAHYHKRSNVETTFSMIKAKFGERLRSKTETAQVNEALCKVLCHNLCVVIQSMYELGIAPEFMSEAEAA